MNKTIYTNYARHQPFYEVAAIAGFWITLLIAALIVEATLK
ncbi:hypothetical protein RN053_02905 [Pantoea dispersa]|nr:hypothetical protein [Pantoea dispersa]MDT8849428.1 hypothetical protein [Pantoea dispersa]